MKIFQTLLSGIIARGSLHCKLTTSYEWDVGILKIGVLKILQISQEKPVLEAIFCFPVKFAKCLRTPIFYRIPLVAASGI